MLRHVRWACADGRLPTSVHASANQHLLRESDFLFSQCLTASISQRFASNGVGGAGARPLAAGLSTAPGVGKDTTAPPPVRTAAQMWGSQLHAPTKLATPARPGTKLPISGGAQLAAEKKPAYFTPPPWSIGGTAPAKPAGMVFGGIDLTKLRQQTDANRARGGGVQIDGTKVDRPMAKPASPDLKNRKTGSSESATLVSARSASFGRVKSAAKSAESADGAQHGRHRVVAKHAVALSGRDAFRAGRRRMTAAQKMTQGRDVARQRIVTITDDTTPRDLAAAMGVKIGRVMTKLDELGEGEQQRPGEPMDPLLAELIVQDAGMKVKRVDGKLKDRARTEPPSSEEMAKLGYPHRAPIITIMGHVDHGKTTLLDALRGTNVAEGEAGGITQGIAAFSVAMRANVVATGDRRAPGGKGAKSDSAKTRNKKDGKPNGKAAGAASDASSDPESDTGGGAKPSSPSNDAASQVDVMTFIDTPGHALFSSMRKRGSSVTDIVVLVVDGKDGVMPQTKECVNLILEAGLPCVVAATKCDVVDPASAIERVGKQLLECGLASEAFGGEVPIVPISARTGLGLQELKESLALQAEMLDLRADMKSHGEGVVMDCRVVKGQGQVVDAVVTWGSLKVGDVVVAGGEFGRVKAILTDAVGATSLNKRLVEGSSSGSDGSGSSSKKKDKDKKGKNNGADAESDGGGSGAGFALSQVQEALPGTPVRVLGLKGTPAAGSDLLAVQDEEAAKAVLEGRKRRAQAEELLRVAAADAVKRDAARDEYKKVRQRKAAYEIAVQRERRRARLRKTGMPLPPDLAPLPWELAILKEGQTGKVVGMTATGKKSRLQGGQQNTLTMDFRQADAIATGAMTGEEVTAENAGGLNSGTSAPTPVAFIIKADSAGSLTAIEDAINIIPGQTTAVLPRVVKADVGEVTENDVEYAATMGAHILAFNAKVSTAVQKMADRKKMKIRSSKVIYHLLDEVCEMLGEYLPSESEESSVAAAEVKAIFELRVTKKSDPETVAGCVIIDGTFTKGLPMYKVVRNGKTIHEAPSLASLRHLKDDVNTVSKGTECGMAVSGFTEYKVGDRIVAFDVQTKKKTLTINFG